MVNLRPSGGIKPPFYCTPHCAQKLNARLGCQQHRRPMHSASRSARVPKGTCNRDRPTASSAVRSTRWSLRVCGFNFRMPAPLNPAQSPTLTGLVAPCPLYGVLDKNAQTRRPPKKPGGREREGGEEGERRRREGRREGRRGESWARCGNTALGRLDSPFELVM